MLVSLTILLLSFGLVDVDSISENNVSFYLFTQNNRQTPLQVTRENVTIDKNCHPVFLVHGWGESYKVAWYEKLKSAYLAKSKSLCVIEVDWSKTASLFYTISAADTKTVGQLIADFILVLVKQGISIKNVQLTGHSLGAHVVGFAGKALIKKSLKLGRITGLDPAGPCFEGLVICVDGLLSKNDADVLVVVHTDRYKFGYSNSFGGVDFFPNNGQALEPGCPEFSSLNDFVFCSHHRSFEYFIDALNRPNTLVGYLCGSYQNFLRRTCIDHKHLDMGGDFTIADFGDYYLTTKAQAPYGQGLIL